MPLLVSPVRAHSVPPKADGSAILESLCYLGAGMLMVLGVIAFFAFGIAQSVVGYMGIEDGLGKWWAIGALVAAFGFRFTLPLTIGTFFGATNVLDWHWFWALLLALPGLAFMIPGLIAAALEAVRGR